MNKYEQLHIYVKVCVYNGVYEGNIPVSMIHWYTRGSGLIHGERPIEFMQQLCKQIFTREVWDLYLHGGPWYFWEDLKKTFIFDLLFKVKNQIDRGMYKKDVCTMKYVISCKGMGLIPMWRPMFYFIKHG